MPIYLSLLSAGKCLALLARGLKNHFQPHAKTCLLSILEKFREKKQNVVGALREAADAIFLAVSTRVICNDNVIDNEIVRREGAYYQ